MIIKCLWQIVISAIYYKFQPDQRNIFKPNENQGQEEIQNQNVEFHNY